MKRLIFFIIVSAMLLGCSQTVLEENKEEQSLSNTHERNVKPDLFNQVVEAEQKSIENTKSKAEWREILEPEIYNILWEKGTERAGSGQLLYEKRDGIYVTAGCKLPVFESEYKYDSGTGWPSFTQPIEENIILRPDYSHGWRRVEVLSKCGEHLGHVFEDGPAPLGLRYCINSLALEFERK